MIGYKWKSVNHDKWFVDPFTGIHTNRIESRYVFNFVWFSRFMIFVPGGSRLNGLCQEVAATSFPGKYILGHDCWMDSQFWISYNTIAPAISRFICGDNKTRLTRKMTSLNFYVLCR